MGVHRHRDATSTATVRSHATNVREVAEAAHRQLEQDVPDQQADRRSIAQRLATLTPDQRRSLARRLRERKNGKSGTGALVSLPGATVGAPDTVPDRPAPSPTGHPLSFAQERLWFLDRFSPGSQSYVIQWAMRLRGPLDVDALRRALDQLAARHDTLRTRYLDDGGTPYQVVDHADHALFDLVDLSTLQSFERDIALEAHFADENRRPFDLAKGPVWRNTLISLGPGDYIFVMSIHHIATDGWSFPIIAAEISELYSAAIEARPHRLPALTMQYLDYAQWQRERSDHGHLDDELSYWSQQLAGRLVPLDLPLDHPRPAVQTSSGSLCTFVISGVTPEDIAGLATESGATPFIVALALFTGFLHRYANSDDVIVGVASADRAWVETEPLVGFFVNTLALRTAVNAELSFRDLVARVRRTALGAYANREVPFERVVQHIRPSRDPSRSPVFQVMFQYGAGALDDKLNLPGIAEEPIDDRAEASLFDMSMDLEDRDGRLHGSLSFNTDLFEEASIERVVGYFGRFAEAALTDPDVPIGDLPMMDATDLHHVLEDLAGHPSPPTSASVLDALHRVRAASPDAAAIIVGDDVLSYAQLHARALDIAQIMQAAGVARGDRVALMMQRSLDLVATILGVLYCGAAYVPLEPDAPQSRIVTILEDSAPKALFVDRLDAAPPFDGPVFTPGDEPARVGTYPALPLEIAGGDAAYIIYTSGTTGGPKGVVVPHAALAALIESTVAAYDLAPGDRLLQFHSFAFDASVEEVFTTLAGGGTLVLRSDDMLGSAQRLLEAAEKLRVTVLSLPTAYWHELAAEAAARDLDLPPSLRLVVIGGEAALPDIVSGWKERYGSHVTLLNCYGPTEVTVTATMAALSSIADTGSRSTTIGRPLPSVSAYVLDRRQQPVPVGVAGELYLGGTQLADGYLNRPQLTADRYIAHPFGGEGRLYRTGDLVRWRRDGRLEFMGRVDRQVKIRGYRVEVDEIQNVLASHPRVVAATVTTNGANGNGTSLTAHVTAIGPLEAAELRAFVARHLPAYMVPTSFEIRDELPRLTGGEIDAAALLATPVLPVEETVFDDETLGPTLARLCGIWSEVLERPVLPTDDFFALGGHSLMAVRLFSRIESECGASLPMPTLFAAPTPRSLLEVLRPHLESAASESTSRVERLGLIRARLSYSQRRLWFLDRLHPGGSAYHVPWDVRLSGPLDRAALQTAFDAIVARHEILRTRFVDEEGTPFQVIDPPCEVPIRFEDLRALDEDERWARFANLVADEESRPFDLAADLMIRVTLVQLADEDYGLLVVAHHIATDADSMDLLETELAHFYEASVSGKTLSLKPLAIQYADFSEWQRLRHETGSDEDSIEYWLRKLAGPRPVLELPIDRPRPASFSYRGSSTEFRVPDDVTAGLVDLASAENATPFSFLLAGLVAILQRHTGETDIIVGTPSTERTLLETEDLIGFFVNTLALRTDVGGDPSFRVLIGRVRESTLEAFTHRDVPFEAIVERLQPERDPSRSPIFQVMCALDQTEPHELRFPGLETSALPAGLDDDTTKFDLTVHGSLIEGELWVSLEYNTDLFDRDTVERLGRNLGDLLEAAVAEPDLPLSLLELIDADERAHLVKGLNDTRRAYPADRTVNDIFAEVSQRYATSIAITENGRSVTYQELAAAASRLAARLRNVGVVPGATVGLCFGRSIDLVVAMLGTLFAGGCYVPLDPSYPGERLAFMRRDAALHAVLRPGGGRIAIEKIDSDGSPRFDDDPPAYVMYTSGSTGAPKGVAIPHRAILRLVSGSDYAPLGPADVVALASNTSFDAVTWEVWGALLNGARLVVVDSDTLISPQALATTLQDEGVTAMFVTTALFNIIAGKAPAAFAPLRHLLFGGEAVNPVAVRRILAGGPPDRLVHVYGPTESTTFASWHLVDDLGVDAGTVPIGLPIANTTLHVLDPMLRPVPIGVPGELHIGGDGLATGYLGDAELSERKFVPDPFDRTDGARLYRTGDIVRRRSDGAIEFLHRADRQVKLRGHRIEPGEIEAHLRRDPLVVDAIVRVRRREDDDRLVAYIVAKPGVTADSAEVLGRLRGTLPRYLVPAHVVMLDALPTGPNGKIDTKRLPEPAMASPAGYEAPQGEAMTTMAELWQNVLDVERVGSTDNFFDLGGHSLLGVELMAAVQRVFGRTVPLSALFEAPTLAEFTDEVSKAGDDSSTKLLVPIHRGGSRPPLFCLHPGGGNVFEYDALARLLGPDQPVLGIQARGVDGRSLPHRSIEEMAAAYIEVIHKAQPRGPYHLLGYSLGGLIAFETGRQLEEQGESVAFLGMLDTSYPCRTSQPSSQEPHVRNARRRWLAGWRRAVSEMWERTRIVLGKVRHGPRWTYYVLRHRPMPLLLAGKRLTHIGFAVNRRYRPGSYRGTVTYFRASGVSGEQMDQPDRPWRDVAADVDVIDIPGHHNGEHSMMQGPYVNVLGSALRARLETLREAQ